MSRGNSECEILDTNIILPPGWKKIFLQRKSGRSAGQYDAYIISPDGKRHRSKNELLVYLEEKGIISDFENFQFNFSKKLPNFETSLNENANEKNSKGNKKRKSDSVYCKSSEISLETSKKQKVETSNIRNKQYILNIDDCDSNKKQLKRNSLPNMRKNKKFCISMNFFSPRSPKKYNSGDAISDSSLSQNVNNDPSEISFIDSERLQYSTDYSYTLNKLYENESDVKGVDKIPTYGNSYKDIAVKRDPLLQKISPYNLIEEILSNNPWKLLIYSILKQHIKSDLEIVEDDLDIFFSKIPDANFCNFENLTTVFNKIEIKFHDSVMEKLVSFSRDFLDNGSSINDLKDINQISKDTYQIFCLGNWKKVISEDADLNRYVLWMWNNQN